MLGECPGSGTQGPSTEPSMTPGGCDGGLTHPTSSQNWGLLGLPHRTVSLSPCQGCAHCCGCSAGAAIGTGWRSVKVPLGQLQIWQTRLCHTLLPAPQGTAVSPPLLSPTQEATSTGHVSHITPMGMMWQSKPSLEPLREVWGSTQPLWGEHRGGRCSCCARSCCLDRLGLGEPLSQCHSEPSAASACVLLQPGHCQRTRALLGLWVSAEEVGTARGGEPQQNTRCLQGGPWH